MATNINISPTAVLVIFGVAVGGFLIYKTQKAAVAFVKDNAKYVNPMSDQNLAYEGVNGIGAAITGDEYWTLGGSIYDSVQAVGTRLDNASNAMKTQEQQRKDDGGWGVDGFSAWGVSG